jgi:hypothetical protein
MMDNILDRKLTIRRLAILIVLYILSGSTYITLFSGSQWVAAFGICLMLPSIATSMRRNVTTMALLRGIFAYGFVIFVLSKGLLNRESLGSYFRVSLIFLFSFYFTQEFSFTEFKSIFTRFIAAICAIDTIIYFVLQRVGQFAFLPIAYNGNGEGYRIGIIFNYLLSHPERNSGIYWEPGLFATMIVLAFVLELRFEQKLHPWRMLIYHICIFTTASSAGIVLILFCDLMLLNRVISQYSSNKAVNYCIFFLVYMLLLTLFLNMDTFLTVTGLAQQRAYAKLLSDNMGSSARMQALSRNWSLFLQNPLTGIGIGGAYRAASNFSDTSTTTFMMVEFGAVGAIPTAFVIKSILGLKNKLIENVCLITIFLCILNKEPHMGIAIIWIFAFFFSKKREKRIVNTDGLEILEKN